MAEGVMCGGVCGDVMCARVCVFLCYVGLIVWLMLCVV